ncbi:hypothetical protein [Haliscomenobacter sp.]|uniref:hypothetical protein n=1 Tax=Haliscomenobacter sp. TaxID=2717303 RepID=UPI003BAD8149
MLKVDEEIFDCVGVRISQGDTASIILKNHTIAKSKLMEMHHVGIVVESLDNAISFIYLSRQKI